MNQRTCRDCEHFEPLMSRIGIVLCRKNMWERKLITRAREEIEVLVQLAMICPHFTSTRTEQ